MDQQGSPEWPGQVRCVFVTWCEPSTLFLLPCCSWSNHENLPQRLLLLDGRIQHSVNFYFSLFNQGPNCAKHHGNHLSTPSPPPSPPPQERREDKHWLLLHSVCGPVNSPPSLFTSVSSANQKAASGAGRLSGEGGDADVSAGCQRESMSVTGFIDMMKSQ